MKPEKYAGIDFKASAAMAEKAQAALDAREAAPPSRRGMTGVGLARARDIINRRELSPQTWRRMLSFFQRHEVDKSGETWDEKGKGWQAWNGWGGDPGYSRARSVVSQMETADNKAKKAAPDGAPDQSPNKPAGIIQRAKALLFGGR